MSAAPVSSIAEAAAIAVHRLPSITAAVDGEPSSSAAAEEPPAAPVEEPANELSAYEQQRLKTIEANQQKLRELGLLDDVEALRAASKPKKPNKKKEPKDATAIAPKRSSRRITGEGVLPDATGDDEDEQSDLLRDPNDVSTMTMSQFKAYCAGLVKDIVERVIDEDELGAEQIQRVHDAEKKWLSNFAEITSKYSGKNFSPISKPNLRSCLKTIVKLVSGKGYAHQERRFLAGRPIGLGITKDEVLELRAEAQLWLPVVGVPADLIGLKVGDEVIVKDPPKKMDLSNGWALNHPLMKLGMYCEFLEECRATSLEQALRRRGARLPTEEGDTSDGEDDTPLLAKKQRTAA